MKRFACQCGQQVFFESYRCTQCRMLLGFDAAALDIYALTPTTDGGFTSAGTSNGQAYRLCRNRIEHKVCNWLIPAEAPHSFCLACGLNEVIPNLGIPRNVTLWARLEHAKRRLIYNLLALGLPVRRPGGSSLAFRFLQDQRSNPAVSESFVLTGHMGGTITINVTEADDSVRHAVREDMLERYRTLLGHFRHESGHVYFDALVKSDNGTLAEFRQLFGDEQVDYQAALAAYYSDPQLPVDWQEKFVSAYASAHPLEDWGETWAHYLHITDTVETAVAFGIIPQPDVSPESREWLATWMSLSIIVNELNRSLGTDDPYPFVLSSRVADKLSFIHRQVAHGALEPAVAAGR